MKNLLMVLACFGMTLMLVGCPQSAETVKRLTEKCEERGGEIVIAKDAYGAAVNVRCTIDGVLYYQGDY